MEYVCLAAGRGTRFGRLGAYLQKCMYPVGLRPFLELSLLEVAAHGGAHVHLVVGHLGEQVRAYFGTRFAGMELTYHLQAEPQGTGHAVGLAARTLATDSTVLVWQADVFLPRALLPRLERHPAPNVLTLVEEAGASPDVLVTAGNDRIERAWQGAGPYSDAGIWRLESRLLTELAHSRAKGGEYRALPNLQALIDGGEAEVGYVTLERRLHVGGTYPTTEENLAEVLAHLTPTSASVRAR